MNLFAASQLEWRREYDPDVAVEADDEIIVVAGSPNMLGDTKPGVYAVGAASDVLTVLLFFVIVASLFPPAATQVPHISSPLR